MTEEDKNIAIEAHRMCCPYKISTVRCYSKNVHVGDDIYCGATEKCRRHCYYMQKFIAELNGEKYEYEKRYRRKD